jgi:hypothetical protein
VQRVPCRRGSIARRRSLWLDAILGDFHPVADADLGADSALEVVKVVEHAHLAAPVVRLKPATSNCHFRHRGRDDEFGLGIGNHLRDADTRRRFHQAGPATGKSNHRHIGDDKVDRSG